MQLIINADDFGRSREVNAAIIRAHRAGTLVSASLMITGDAWEEAVELAHQIPTLAVGLHVVAVDGPTVTGAKSLAGLVDARGHLPAKPLRLGVAYACNAVHRRAIATEIEAQFARFAATGLGLSHVDGHWNMHLHPALSDIILPLAAQHGARGVRVVREWSPLSVRWFRLRMLGQLPTVGIFQMLSSRTARRARALGLAVTDVSFGLIASGRMRENVVLRAMERASRAGVRSMEMVFHPTAGPQLERLGPNPGDLAALLSPALRQRLGSGDIVLSQYRDLPGTGVNHGDTAGGNSAGRNGRKLDILDAGGVVRAPRPASQPSAGANPGAAFPPGPQRGALPADGFHPQTTERR